MNIDNQRFNTVTDNGVSEVIEQRLNVLFRVLHVIRMVNRLSARDHFSVLLDVLDVDGHVGQPALLRSFRRIGSGLRVNLFLFFIGHVDH